MLRSVDPRDALNLEKHRHTTRGTAVPPCIGSFYETRCKYKDIGDGQPNR
jgi:hypothetical protein